MLDARSEFRSVNAVAISQQESRRFIIWKGIHDLLGRPSRRRILSHVEMHDAALIVTQNDEAIEQAEADRRNDEEVDGRDVADVVLEERPPILRRRLAMANHVSRDRRFRHDVPQQLQFGLNPQSAPRRVFLGNAADQFADFGVDFRSAVLVPRFPSPVEPKTAAMPANDCFRITNHEAGSPIRPEPRQPDPENPVALPQSRAFHRTLEDDNLLSQRQVFGRNDRAGQKKRPDKNSHNAKETHAIPSILAPNGLIIAAKYLKGKNAYVLVPHRKPSL